MPEMTIQQAVELGVKHHHAGQLEQAETIYRQVLAVDPNCADALHLLGLIGLQTNHLEPARELVEAAVSKVGNIADYHRTLGDIYGALRRPADAAKAYQRAVELNPEFVEAWNNMGVAFADLGRTEEAITAYRRTIELRPDSPNPYTNLSHALREQGLLDEAIAAARQALACDPNFPDAFNNLGVALFRQGKTQEAIDAFRKAISLRSDYPLAHANLGMALLRRGDFEEGWVEYEWRARMSGFFKLNVEAATLWNGEDISGRRILLHVEQGFGDALQFIRYAPLLAERGAKVLVACQPELARLFRSVPGIEQVIIPNDQSPPFDVHCPLPSLPKAFKTTLQTIPANVPYFKVEPEPSAHWRSRLSEDPRPKKVGLVWSGRVDYGNDRSRAMGLAALAPLGAIKNVCWVSLQKGDGADQARRPPDGLELFDWTQELKDFADSAALIENLDLVITVDTAVAHLAGGLGKPVWVILPTTADWRWMLDRDDSPWYPTMRLFRQPAAGDWNAAVYQLASELQTLMR
ncbi:MAG TPA: tetratricopeptide repeat protein [Tepidisphaeraceae bacterium]|nr:tetratricopeptide repeat protein [Tepidisphaeraceae bacterium]